MFRMLYLSLQHVQTQHHLIASRVGSVFVCMLIAVVMQSTDVEFAYVAHSNIALKTCTFDIFEIKYVVIRSNQRLTTEQE